VLVGAGLAQVVLFDVLLGDDLGDVQGGGIGTLLALHRRTPGTGPRYPIPRRHSNRGGDAVKQGGRGPRPARGKGFRLCRRVLLRGPSRPLGGERVKSLRILFLCLGGRAGGRGGAPPSRLAPGREDGYHLAAMSDSGRPGAGAGDHPAWLLALAALLAWQAWL